MNTGKYFKPPEQVKQGLAKMKRRGEKKNHSPAGVAKIVFLIPGRISGKTLM